MAGITRLGADPVLKYDIAVEQGADYRRSIPVVGLGEGDTLAGWSVAGQIWSADPPAVVLDDLDVALSGTSVQLTIPHATSTAWEWDLARYAIDLTDPSGSITRFVEGWVTVERRAAADAAVVTRQMLRSYMSDPQWTPAQTAEADRVLQGVEAELSAALSGAPITPVPRNEVVSVTREGMVATSLPVAQLLTINGVTVITDSSTGLPVSLPTGYTLRDHYLWQSGTANGGGYGYAPWRDSWGYDSGRRVDLDRGFGGGPYYTGYTVALTYLGGWGAEPALVQAILRKAARRMSGQHADTVVITGLNAQPANTTPAESPNFTDDDLKVLGRFRNLGWGA